ncbi:MAG: 30S ribosomal protein S9 [Candidatus Moranbacteria bacterium]|nr:30S ribosomal protein S9 [Candidatus Moranbacteria bacterium]
MKDNKNSVNLKQTETVAKRYWFGLGRRKTSMALVRLYESKEKENKVIVNTKDFNKYFFTKDLKKNALNPLDLAQDKKFFITVKTQGGGIRGQSDAIKLGIARALLNYDDKYKEALKQGGYLTRDPRTVERKKPGLKKARRSPQFSKR